MKELISGEGRKTIASDDFGGRLRLSENTDEDDVRKLRRQTVY
jgi:hypothetical protein